MKVSHESIRRIESPKPFENGYEWVTDFNRFEKEYPWILIH